MFLLTIPSVRITLIRKMRVLGIDIGLAISKKEKRI